MKKKQRDTFKRWTKVTDDRKRHGMTVSSNRGPENNHVFVCFVMDDWDCEGKPELFEVRNLKRGWK